jgi:hypothetical protein
MPSERSDNTQLVFGAPGVRVTEAGMIPHWPFILSEGYPSLDWPFKINLIMTIRISLSHLIALALMTFATCLSYSQAMGSMPVASLLGALSARTLINALCILGGVVVGQIIQFFDDEFETLFIEVPIWIYLWFVVNNDLIYA